MKALAIENNFKQGQTVFRRDCKYGRKYIVVGYKQNGKVVIESVGSGGLVDVEEDEISISKLMAEAERY